MRLCCRLLAACLAMGGAAHALAAPRCAMTCRQEVAACKKTRCAGLERGARRACAEDCRGRAGCPTRIRTVAYVVTACRQTPGGTIGSQAVVVRRGDCDPLTVMSLGSAELVTDPFIALGGLCRLFGQTRGGYRSVLAGGFTRLGVSPDGSVVVFELTNDFSLLPTVFELQAEEGIYVVGADGRGLRRLGPASRNASGRIEPAPGTEIGLATSTYDVLYRFSPDGRTIVFTDRGPGPAGEDAIQVVTLDLSTGRRTRLTRLPDAEQVRLAEPVTSVPRFADDDTIVFFTYTNPDGQHPSGSYFTVRRDGSGLRPVSTPIAIPGSRILSTFDIGGGGTNLLGIELSGTPVDFPENSITEVFLLDGENLLQLTNFRRANTGFLGKLLDRRARRAYFVASADPFGANPTENCQLFSSGMFGGGLRQITRFGEGKRSVNGCTHDAPPGCGVGPLFQDPVTRRFVFYASCDPWHGLLRRAALRDESRGSGLRQLTATRGMVTEAGGVVSVEMPGPVAYSAFDGGR